MALITCGECGHSVSDKATACPTCGAPPVALESETQQSGGSTEPPLIGLPPKPPASTKAKRKNASSFWQLVGLTAAIVILFAIFGPDPTPEQIAEREVREAERAVVAAEAVVADAAEEDEDRRRGFHCLRAWDGSHRLVVDTVEAALRNPSSFEHVETRVTVIDENGRHRFLMQYRAENGFGGMNSETVSGTYANANCNDVSFD